MTSHEGQSPAELRTFEEPPVRSERSRWWRDLIFAVIGGFLVAVLLPLTPLGSTVPWGLTLIHQDRRAADLIRRHWVLLVDPVPKTRAQARDDYGGQLAKAPPLELTQNAPIAVGNLNPKVEDLSFDRAVVSIDGADAASAQTCGKLVGHYLLERFDVPGGLAPWGGSWKIVNETGVHLLTGTPADHTVARLCPARRLTDEEQGGPVPLEPSNVISISSVPRKYQQPDPFTTIGGADFLVDNDTSTAWGGQVPAPGTEYSFAVLFDRPTWVIRIDIDSGVRTPDTEEWKAYGRPHWIRIVGTSQNDPGTGPGRRISWELDPDRPTQTLRYAFPIPVTRLEFYLQDATRCNLAVVSGLRIYATKGHLPEPAELRNLRNRRVTQSGNGLIMFLPKPLPDECINSTPFDVSASR
jgi:hypothetical protein